MKLTPAQIVKRMGLPIRDLGDGVFGCPVCEYTQPDYRIGPHMHKHWREAGVKHPPHSTDRLPCVVPGCKSKDMERQRLSGHLVEVHYYERPKAAAIARVAGFDLAEYKRREAAEAATSTALDVVPVEPEPGSNGFVIVEQLRIEVANSPAISPTDAALAVVMSAANGRIATDLLPDIVQYVDDTRALLARIAQS